MKKVTIKIGGMHCTSCVMNIEWALEDLPGAKKVSVSYAKQIAEIETEEDRDPAELVAAVRKLGYDAEIVQ